MSRGEASFGPQQAYPRALNTNHFCWVDLVVSDANALVTFMGVPVFCCNGACGCGGCSTGDITYSYSGYELDFAGHSCSCAPNDDDGGHGHDDPHGVPSGPGVTASFTTRAVVFEDEYENEPGVTVPRRSTNTGVEFYVYGGTNGGTYAFTFVNGAKLIQIDGGTLPVTGHVAAAESVAVMARFEGRAASGGEGDIVAKAEFTEDETGRTLTDATSALTAVKVEVEPAESISGCQYRHKMGVCDKFSQWIKCDITGLVTHSEGIR